MATKIFATIPAKNRFKAIPGGNCRACLSEIGPDMLWVPPRDSRRSGARHPAQALHHLPPGVAYGNCWITKKAHLHDDPRYMQVIAHAANPLRRILSHGSVGGFFGSSRIVGDK